MAHQIETHNGKAAFVTANIPAWHQLGTVLDGAFTAEQAMELGRLGGWNVRKSPLFVAETGQPAEGAYATIRDNPFEVGQVDVLGIVGETYRPVQNEEMTDILNILVDESGAVFDTAGSLRGGTQTFVTMKLPGHMLIGGARLRLQGQGPQAHARRDVTTVRGVTYGAPSFMTMRWVA